jgi:uncharacterized membrane protein YozB (DUF420 family)
LDVIDEHYERSRAHRRRLERFAVRGIVITLVAMAIASSVAALMPGLETFDGTRRIECTRAGDFRNVVVAVISCVMMALAWRWPRPRSVVFAGVALWVAAAIVLVVTYAPRHHGDEPKTYSYVFHQRELDLADLLMSTTVVAWIAVPIAAFVYGAICVAVDDHVRRQLPPAPEFPIARIR